MVEWCGECGLWGDHLRAGHLDLGGIGIETVNIGAVEDTGDANVAETVVVEYNLLEDSDGGVLSRLRAAGLL